MTLGVYIRISVSNKYMKTCQLRCTPVSVSSAGYSSLSPGLYTGISVSDKVYEDQCQLHCYPVYQSVTQGGLSLEMYTRISVSNKVYEDLPATLYPDVSVSNLGYTLGTIDLPEYRSATKYIKTCRFIVPWCIRQ